MNPESDLTGIANLMRRHIEIRNRSWLKRVHRDCFIGSDAVDFLVTQGFADTRKAGVEMGLKMATRKLIRNITDSRKFSDTLHYYRFQEDDDPKSVLAEANAGNGSGVTLGHGGCKWSFAPHTAHNSYVMDIGLAEEIERAVAGASIEARAHAISKLRSRIREQAEPDAPNWELFQTQNVNGALISVFQRKRPRGDWTNVKINGVVAESPVGFVRSIMSFEKRRQWESHFEDGVIVEGIDIGEKASVLLTEEEEGTTSSKSAKDAKKDTQPEPSVPSDAVNTRFIPLPVALPENVKDGSLPKVARATDDVYTFLQTVDMAGIPDGMAIAFLNDPERQHALAHLRKQMMLSNPQECMLCQTPFEDPTDIRFCPCCAMVSCAGCVSKRVFEIVSRNVMSVCVHCYRESSRIFQPPQAVQDETTVNENLRGKWWRPEALGIVDYSTMTSSSASTKSSSTASHNPRESMSGPSLYNDQDVLISTAGLRPLIPGLLDDVGPSSAPNTTTDAGEPLSEGEEDESDLAAVAALSISPAKATTPTTATSKSPPPPATAQTSSPAPPAAPAASAKTARCKNCGMMISRDMEAIEAHMEECIKTNNTKGKGVAAAGSGGFIRSSIASVAGTGAGVDANKTFTISPESSAISVHHGNYKQFAGIPRHHDLAKKYATRIIYRTARPESSGGPSGSREVCALQDSFVDSDGTAYLYEISVRHSEVRGISDYVTADVMLLLHVARPIKGNKTASQITVINQIDSHSKGGILVSFGLTSDATKNPIAGLRKEDLVRELKMCADLPNLLAANQDDFSEESNVTLDDFELLAVLGRGGFGKVMQVRHKTSDTIYAMKILKKSELRRRRQVERTQTERTILANVRHPFIVCLHYAFQNAQKLYMVMDFVQGGDFFTLMRKFRKLPEDWVRLYVLQVAMALEHLHEREIVYRDLKPENILLCADGYLKLTDFGLSRYFETRPPNPEDIVDHEKEDYVTRSFCGTEQYMSPEMLLQQGHNYRMDWWCLGLLMHEMISGRHPFHGTTHYDTLRNMVTKPPTIDPRLSPQAAAIVKSLLIKNPRTRLGGKEGISELKQIPYFSLVNWDELMGKKIDMPYKPKLAGEMDISSFETTFTKEKPIDSIPEPDKRNESDKKKAANKGLLGIFGLGSSPAAGGNAGNKPGEEMPDPDAFKGFSFTKEGDTSLYTTSASNNQK